MEEKIDTSTFQSLTNKTSLYEAQFVIESEKAEEFHNEFYKSPGVTPTKNYKTKIPEDVLSESEPEEEKIPFDEDIEEYLRSAGIDHKIETLPSEEEEENFSSPKESSSKPEKVRNSHLKVLSPVRKAETKEIEIPELLGVEEIDYRTFLHREIGESREMFHMREKIAHMLAKADIPRGSRFVTMDNQTIVLLSRMITNKLWFGMKYNKDQETLLKYVSEYIPGLDF
jgi:hypothetical protein